MATDADSTIATVILFPLDRARQPDPVHHAVDTWYGTQNIAQAACVFRNMGEVAATAAVREMMLNGGAKTVALMLEEIGLATKSMRRIVDELVSIEAIISGAADRALAEASV